MKFTEEEKDDLAAALDHEGMKSFWRLLEASLRAIEGDVLKYDLSTGTQEQLAYSKCRAEGAARLLTAVKTRLESMKAPKPKK